MNWKLIGKTLLFPHIAFIILFLPISISLLIFSLIYLSSTSFVSILSYLLAFYMLVVISARVPRMITFFKKVKNENKYIKKLLSDSHLRLNISLYGSLIWNGTFAIFQLGLGFYHGSIWFYSMSAYYVMLAIMRFFLLKHTRVYKANEETEKELKTYYLCGWLLLIMNLAVAIIIFFITYWNRTFHHHEITTITLAAYTFVTFTFAIINSIKCRKFNSPIYSSVQNISLIAAVVSILTLETTMLTTFGGNNLETFRQIILAATGIAVSIFTITMSLIMIIKGKKQLTLLNSNKKQ
jgi:hypothetical protein